MAPVIVKAVIFMGVAESRIAKPYNGSRGSRSWKVGVGVEVGQGGVGFGHCPLGAKDTLSHTS